MLGSHDCTHSSWIVAVGAIEVTLGKALDLLEFLHCFHVGVAQKQDDVVGEIQKNKYPALLKRISDYAHELTTLAGYLFTP